MTDIQKSPRSKKLFIGIVVAAAVILILFLSMVIALFGHHDSVPKAVKNTLAAQNKAILENHKQLQGLSSDIAQLSHMQAKQSVRLTQQLEHLNSNRNVREVLATVSKQSQRLTQLQNKLDLISSQNIALAHAAEANSALLTKLSQHRASQTRNLRGRSTKAATGMEAKKLPFKVMRILWLNDTPKVVVYSLRDLREVMLDVGGRFDKWTFIGLQGNCAQFQQAHKVVKQCVTK